MASSSAVLPVAVAYAEPAASNLVSVVGDGRAEVARPLASTDPLDDVGRRASAWQAADVLKSVAGALGVLLRAADVRPLFVDVKVGASRASQYN